MIISVAPDEHFDLSILLDHPHLLWVGIRFIKTESKHHFEGTMITEDNYQSEAFKDSKEEAEGPANYIVGIINVYNKD